MDRIALYRQMARARAFEVALGELWSRGDVSGEMHLGTGEEAIAAAVTEHMREGDAVAIDHRSTPVLLLLGVDPAAIVAECLGRPDGLCGGHGGHMHLFSKEHLAASSGIVGSAGPTATGFGLAARRLRPGSVAVALFGDGAANQGMMLESINLAAAWRLPVVFVCKDNGWAIYTRSAMVTGGSLDERARAFGLFAERADGTDVVETTEAAGRCFAHVRKGRGPAFLHATCPRLDAHFMGDVAREPESPHVRHMIGGVLTGAMRRNGGSLRQRMRSMARMTGTMVRVQLDHRDGRQDPLARARKSLGKAHQEQVAEIDAEIDGEIRRVLALVGEGGEA